MATPVVHNAAAEERGETLRQLRQVRTNMSRTRSQSQMSATTTSDGEGGRMGRRRNSADTDLYQRLISTELPRRNVHQVAIIRERDHSVRAHSSGFVLPPVDVRALVSAFEEPSKTRNQGLLLESAHYDAIRADSLAIYCKREGGGLVAVKTHRAVVVGTYTDRVYPSVAVETVERIASQLRKAEVAQKKQELQQAQQKLAAAQAQ